MVCNHVWEFHTCGVNFQPPQRAIFVCMICKERIKQQVIPGTAEPEVFVGGRWRMLSEANNVAFKIQVY